MPINLIVCLVCVGLALFSFCTYLRINKCKEVARISKRILNGITIVSLGLGFVKFWWLLGIIEIIPCPPIVIWGIVDLMILGIGIYITKAIRIKTV